MRTIKKPRSVIRDLRTAIGAVPETADRARKSLDQLDSGVRQANSTMAILATVALLALVFSTVALVQSRSIELAARRPR